MQTGRSRQRIPVGVAGGPQTWIGGQYWADPLRDRRVERGEVVAQAGASRTLHLLSHQADASHGGFEMEVTVPLASSG